MPNRIIHSFISAGPHHMHVDRRIILFIVDMGPRQMISHQRLSSSTVVSAAVICIYCRFPASEKKNMSRGYDSVDFFFAFGLHLLDIPLPPCRMETRRIQKSYFINLRILLWSNEMGLQDKSSATRIIKTCCVCFYTS